MIEFDHLFIFTTAGAPVVDALKTFGFQEGTSNVHLGQGTQNRRIFFHNAMLEFLWATNEQEIQSSVVKSTQLWERSRYLQTGYSPFGILFRPQSVDDFNRKQLPFATWAYQPPYLPPHLLIDVARDIRPEEPFLAVIPMGKRPDALSGTRAQPLDHACGVQEITRITISLPSAALLSEAIAAVQTDRTVQFKTGGEHLAEIEFDGGTEGKRIDLRPQLPLCLYW